MKLVTAIMSKTIKATAIMTRKEVVSADLAEAKAAVDAANEEVSADLDAGIALVASNYSDIKAEIAAKGVDMTGVKPSGYDEAIASIVAASGDAVAGDILAGKTAATSAGLITGTRPPAPVAWTGVAGESGEAWPDPRFTDNGNGTVTDNLTGLMWTKTMAVGGYVLATWEEAKSRAKAVTLGGFSDWRLPVVAEYNSLLSWNNALPMLPTGHPFTEYVSGLHWSATSQPDSEARAYRANIRYGDHSAALKTTTAYVWAVRGPIAL